MPTTVAVTGASGHIGNVVCRKLIEGGYQVRAFYYKDQRALDGLNLQLVRGNILNKEDLSRLINGCEIVIHCAAIISINGDPDGMVFKTNTEGPKNVLAASIEHGVRKIIHISSVHAVTELPHSLSYDESRPYKNSDSFAYDYSKAMGEQLLLSAARKGLTEIVILRPSCAIGPFDFKPSKMGAALIDFYLQKIPFLPEGGYDLVDVRDLADSIINAISNGRDGDIFLLSGKYYSLKDLARAIKAVTGKKVPQKVIPYRLLKMLLPFVSAYAKITQSAPSFTRESIDALIHGHPNMDCTKARTELNHKCRPLEDTLSDFFKWQKENGVI